jgi:hypothetical protein
VPTCSMRWIVMRSTLAERQLADVAGSPQISRLRCTREPGSNRSVASNGGSAEQRELAPRGHRDQRGDVASERPWHESPG